MSEWIARGANGETQGFESAGDVARAKLRPSTIRELLGRLL